jgi:hypothetical protein
MERDDGYRQAAGAVKNVVPEQSLWTMMCWLEKLSDEWGVVIGR